MGNMCASHFGRRVSPKTSAWRILPTRSSACFLARWFSFMSLFLWVFFLIFLFFLSFAFFVLFSFSRPYFLLINFFQNRFLYTSRFDKAPIITRLLSLSEWFLTGCELFGSGNSYSLKQIWQILELTSAVTTGWRGGTSVGYLENGAGQRRGQPSGYSACRRTDAHRFDTRVAQLTSLYQAGGMAPKRVGEDNSHVKIAPRQKRSLTPYFPTT